MQSIEKDFIIVTVMCPLCKKKDILSLSIKELESAKKQQTLISKAIVHQKDHHVLTLYIDSEGNVRRKYTFLCIKQNEKESLSVPNPRTTLTKIFLDMKKKSMESE